MLFWSIWLDIGLVSFGECMALDSPSVHKHPPPPPPKKKDLSQYPAFLTSCLVNNLYLILTHQAWSITLICYMVTPWAGEMNQNLNCDWLPERARRSYLDRSSLRSRRFQKLTRRKRNTPSPLAPNFCPPQACSFARTLFRLLVRPPPGKGKETVSTQTMPALDYPPYPARKISPNAIY